MRHICVLFAFSTSRNLLVPVGTEDLTTATSRYVKDSLLVQDNTQEGLVDVDLTVVLNEA
jgi:hypothetical protein